MTVPRMRAQKWLAEFMVESGAVALGNATEPVAELPLIAQVTVAIQTPGLSSTSWGALGSAGGVSAAAVAASSTSSKDGS